MESHTVKDNIHVIQCFCCQEHGHKKVITNVNIKMMVKTPVYIVVATMNPEIVDSKKIAPSGTA